MDDARLLLKLDRVAAPPDFEARVAAELRRRRAGRPAARRARTFRAALAAAAAAMVVGFVVLNLSVFRPLSESGPEARANLAGARPDSEIVPVIESVEYGREVRGASRDPGAVYILEQIGDAGNKAIRY